MTSTSEQGLIYTAPPLTIEDEAVLGEIHQMRKEMRHSIRRPKRWVGGLRRAAQAKALKSSNSIEGIEVTEDDAAAVVDGEEPVTADQKTALDVQGYQRAMDYVLTAADDRHATYDAAELRAMHFMLIQHEPAKLPGRFRPGSVSVYDEENERVVYEGPDAEEVPALVEALIAALRRDNSTDPIVRSAMAHLNLVMIHPFKDGNGRMARALATLVLTRSDIGEPVFSSIEEWLGASKANTLDYYAVLAHTGHGHWAPRPDPHMWLTFNLRAHHMQAQTVARRFAEASHNWAQLEQLAKRNGLPERVMDALFDAVLGYRVRRSGYAKRTEVEGHTATRDLSLMADVGLLTANGTGRGRFYTAGAPLLALRTATKGDRKPLRDPYPWLRPKLAESVDMRP